MGDPAPEILRIKKKKEKAKKALCCPNCLLGDKHTGATNKRHYGPGPKFENHCMLSPSALRAGGLTISFNELESLRREKVFLLV